MAANPSIQLGTDGNWAIKEDNLLAYKKDGDRFFNKEFDFTRGSFATFVDKDGLIKTAGLQATNLVQNGDFSEIGPELVTNGNFDSDSDWNKDDSWSISGGKANYDYISGRNLNSSTTTLIVGKTYQIEYTISNYISGSVENSSAETQISNNSNGTYTEVFTARYTFLRFRGSTNGEFSIDNVSVKQVDPNDYWTLGTGWSFGDGKLIGDGAESNTFQSGVVQNGNTYKITLTAYNITTGYISVRVGSGGTENYQVNSNGTQTFIATADNGNLLLFRNQSNFNGSISNISVQEIQADTPRIDFTDDITGHLLLEPQSTNLVTYSEDFSDSSWNKESGATIQSNTSSSPDGSINASYLKAPATTNATIRVTYTFSSTSSQAYVGSIFVKKDNVDFIRMLSTGATASTIQAFYNVSNGTLGSSGTPSKAAIEDYGNGWYRLSLIIDAVNTSSSATFRVQLAKSDGAVIDNFDGTEKNLIWGAQLEQLPYATSYIPTFGSTATRNAEVCNNSGSAQDFNSEEGVLYADIAFLNDTGNYKAISINDGTANNKVAIENRPVSNQVKVLVIVGGVSVMGSTQTLTDTKSFNKMALKWKQNDFSWWVNGVKIYTDSSGNTFGNGVLNRLNLNGALTNFSFEGKTKNVQVFKRAMSDGELYLLTVTQYQSYQEMATALNYTL